MVKKLRILFPYVEAGLGHIVPMKAFVSEFEKEHSDEFEIIESDFYKEDNDQDLIKYETWLCNFVKLFAFFPFLGNLVTFFDCIIPINIASNLVMRAFHRKAYKKSLKKMDNIHADIVFSTHWATNYYAHKIKQIPYTILYCPDCELINAFSYFSDLTLISTEIGYKKGLKKKHRFNENNLKMTKFLIRNRAFEIPYDKYENRKNLNLPIDNFTIMFMEGGYGIGKMEFLCKKLVNDNRNITIIAACGRNVKLYKKFMSLEVNKNVTFVPLKINEDVLPYIASCDLFVGKGGNSIAEPTFFSHPSIISTLSTGIEKKIARFYQDDVGSSVICTKKKDLLKLINTFIDNPSLLKSYEEKAYLDHNRYGAKECVEIVYNQIKREVEANGKYRN